MTLTSLVNKGKIKVSKVERRTRQKQSDDKRGKEPPRVRALGRETQEKPMGLDGTQPEGDVGEIVPRRTLTTEE